jgi:hypothetical protein
VYCLVGIVQGRDTGLWQLAVCGLLIGVAMLIRPIAIGLGVVLAVLVLLGAPRRRTLAAVVLLAGNLVAVAPWEAWVYFRTGSIVALSSASPASLRDGLTFAVRSKGFREGLWVPEQTREVMQHISDQYPTLTSASAVGRVLAHEFAAHPVGVVQLAALKAARSWYGTDSQRQDTMVLCLQALYLAVIGVASAIGWRSGGVARRAIVAAWTITAYFWAMTIVSTSLVRYMVPAMSLLFVIVPAVRSRALDDTDLGSEGAL